MVDWWDLSDEQLLAQCDVDHYRASGPGGQKRNKTDSAVRLRHRPTSLVITAVESRSQHENRRRAVRRLREALAFQVRRPVTDNELARLTSVSIADGKLSLSIRDARFLPIASLILDLLDREQGRLAETARAVGVSTANLSAFLLEPISLWQAAQEIRQSHGLRPLQR